MPPPGSCSPWLALPLLWWLLRVTPPGAAQRDLPRRFACCSACNATEETPARTPWWLLALRLLAAALVIVALARPVLDAGPRFAGKGPVLLVMDNGWAAAADWPRRMQAANTMLDRAARSGREAALLATAPDESGAPIAVSAACRSPTCAPGWPRCSREPWPPDRAAAAEALRRLERSRARRRWCISPTA